MLLEGEFTADSLLGLVSELLHRPERLRSMSEAMKGLAVTDATERIASLVLSLADGRK